MPAWFGIAESVASYVAEADRSPSVIAELEGRDVGLLTITSHSPYSAEVQVMGVLPEYHRHGIGRAMLRHGEHLLAEQGVEFLQVKTLSASRPDGNYEKTRAFYLAYGFRPLQEFPELWGKENPALQMIKVVEAREP